MKLTIIFCIWNCVTPNKYFITLTTFPSSISIDCTLVLEEAQPMVKFCAKIYASKFNYYLAVMLGIISNNLTLFNAPVI